MKALTICQPYAAAIAKGLKPVENRWATAYRGPLLIHAGASRKWLATWEESDIEEALADAAAGRRQAAARPRGLMSKTLGRKVSIPDEVDG